MIKKMGYQWRLRVLMAQRELYQTTDLVPLLAERGVVLSRASVSARYCASPPALDGRAGSVVRHP